jgi:hypothetical protein
VKVHGTPLKCLTLNRAESNSAATCGRLFFRCIQ